MTHLGSDPELLASDSSVGDTLSDLLFVAIDGSSIWRSSDTKRSKGRAGRRARNSLATASRLGVGCQESIEVATREKVQDRAQGV